MEMIFDAPPLLSVILCFYNEEKFLSESIESVLIQDYINWELILVDDGSTDGSTAIAKRYSKNFPQKIFYTHHPGHCNEGLSASRNFGISKSKGDLIALIDADDVWLPNKLSAQLVLFKNHPQITVLLEASEYWYSWSSTSKSDIIVKVGVDEGLYEPPALIKKLYPLGRGAAPCPCGIVAHRSIFKRHDFEESFRGIYQMYEDQAFLAKVYLTEKVYVSHACHNRYRQRPASLVSSVHHNGKYHIVRSHYLNWFFEYLKIKGNDFPQVKQLVRKAMMPYRDPVKYKLFVDVPNIVRGVISRVFRKIARLKLSKV